VPIVVLSSRGDEAAKVQALDLGGDDYVTKPFSRRPRGRCFAQPKDAIRQSIDTASPKIFALHKFTPKRACKARNFHSPQPAKSAIFQ